VEAIHRNLPSELRRQIDIIPVGNRLDGKGIPRFWMVKTGFQLRKEVSDFQQEINRILPIELFRRVQIEGGEFQIYPPNPASEVTLHSSQGEIIHRDKILRLEAPAGITLKKVPVGQSFHWEHTEDLIFKGILELRGGENGLLVINELPLEDYLASVNSSEMSAYAPLEFLQAQTVAARGTVLATKGCHHYGEPFDLCNGDHCQCYYGQSRLQPRSLEAVETTAGQVLIHRGIICDTRYAKICGGVTETFDNVWENYNPEYLPGKFDGEEELSFPPIASMLSAFRNDINNLSSIYHPSIEKYIQNPPRCYCNPNLYPYPDYLAEARKWFRWNIDYSRGELSNIINRRIPRDIGTIKSLPPQAWGNSGRIKRMTLIGEKGECELNGELRIRRALSSPHLPSSCFIIEQDGDNIKLKGAGWGHGVGLCQMGALNMAISGKKSEEILQHYYPGGGVEGIKDKG
jgi:SpoIID/LytB domain protein